MKKMPCAVVFVLLSFMWIAMAGADQDNAAATQDQAIQPNTSIDGEQIIPPEAGIDWKSRVMMFREIKKRGQASRNLLLGEAAKERQKKPPMPTKVKSPTDI
ncbi:MAG: hypothetical protein K9N21_01280 [Deltaproteobacteria bacterium]|nr:hypothetical protein [Deltaproteobacteria bacterium]